jgi:hypothetical protein
MLVALYDEITTPLSTFEVLEQCVFMVERCGSQQHATLDSEPAVTPEQLRQHAEIDRIRAAGYQDACSRADCVAVNRFEAKIPSQSFGLEPV